MSSVEAIIERIESGEIGLEESILEYERGVGLLRRCRDALQKAERRVADLTDRMRAEAEESNPPASPARPASSAQSSTRDESPAGGASPSSDDPEGLPF